MLFSTVVKKLYEILAILTVCFMPIIYSAAVYYSPKWLLLKTNAGGDYSPSIMITCVLLSIFLITTAASADDSTKCVAKTEDKNENENNQK